MSVPTPVLYAVIVIWAISAIGLIVFVLLHSGKGTGLSEAIAGSVYGGDTGTSIVEKNLARSERGGGPRPKAQAAGRASEQEGDDEGLEVAGSSHAEASDVDELPGALRALVAPFCAHNTFGGMADAE